jgi:hypothetical protein
MSSARGNSTPSANIPAPPDSRKLPPFGIGQRAHAPFYTLIVDATPGEVTLSPASACCNRSRQ